MKALCFLFVDTVIRFDNFAVKLRRPNGFARKKLRRGEVRGVLRSINFILLPQRSPHCKKSAHYPFKGVSMSLYYDRIRFYIDLSGHVRLITYFLRCSFLAMVLLCSSIVVKIHTIKSCSLSFLQNTIGIFMQCFMFWQWICTYCSLALFNSLLFSFFGPHFYGRV